MSRVRGDFASRLRWGTARMLAVIAQHLGNGTLRRGVPAVCVAVVLVASVSAWQLVLGAAWARWSDAGRVAARFEAVTEEQAALHDRLIAAAQRVAELRREARLMPSRLGDASRLNPRISRILAVAKRHHVAVDSVQPGPSRTDALFARTPITLRVVSDFGTLSAFAADLHANFPDTQTWSIRLTAEPGRRPTRVLDVSAEAPETLPPMPVRAELELDWFTALRTEDAVAEVQP